MLKIKKINENNFQNIPAPCRYCLYWQTTGEFSEENLKPTMEEQKRKWLSEVNNEFGDCLKIAYFNDALAGFMQYAPAKFFPRLNEYASGPPSEDAVFISCLYILNKELRGKGLGTTMLMNLLTEFKTKGCKAVETFARRNSSANPSGPVKLYLKCGFRVKCERDDFPLVRLEL